LRIGVLLKQVLKAEKAGVRDDFTADRSRRGAKQLNPADKSALLAAVELKKRYGGEIICLTMGPASAEKILHEAAMDGADRICLITDPIYAGSDTLATSAILAAALAYIGNPELVLCGRRSIDGETGQVGPQTAIRLGYSCVTNVLSLKLAEARSVEVSRLSELKIEKLLVSLPAIVCVCETNTLSQLPDIASIRKASNIQTEMLSNKELKISQKECGLSGSLTKVLHIHRRSTEKRNTRYAESSEEGVELVLSLLKQTEILK
jgi:electron transfer flavoprotein beta subunit